MKYCYYLWGFFDFIFPGGQLNLVYDGSQKKKLVWSVCKHPNYGINAAVKNTVHDVGDKNTWWSMTDGTVRIKFCTLLKIILCVNRE